MHHITPVLTLNFCLCCFVLLALLIVPGAQVVALVVGVIIHNECAAAVLTHVLCAAVLLVCVPVHHGCAVAKLAHVVHAAVVVLSLLVDLACAVIELAHVCCAAVPVLSVFVDHGCAVTILAHVVFTAVLVLSCFVYSRCAVTELTGVQVTVVAMCIDRLLTIVPFTSLLWLVLTALWTTHASVFGFSSCCWPCFVGCDCHDERGSHAKLA
jgi:hypothetical protein